MPPLELPTVKEPGKKMMSLVGESTTGFRRRSPSGTPRSAVPLRCGRGVGDRDVRLVLSPVASSNRVGENGTSRSPSERRKEREGEQRRDACAGASGRADHQLYVTVMPTVSLYVPAMTFVPAGALTYAVNTAGATTAVYVPRAGQAALVHAVANPAS